MLYWSPNINLISVHSFVPPFIMLRVDERSKILRMKKKNFDSCFPILRTFDGFVTKLNDTWEGMFRNKSFLCNNLIISSKNSRITTSTTIWSTRIYVNLLNYIENCALYVSILLVSSPSLYLSIRNFFIKNICHRD